MKKNLIYALMSAIALTGAVGFSSCSEEEMAEVNPNYDPETNEVYTKFVFNVSTSNTPTTRQSSDATQALATSPFRGIDNAYIMTFKQSGGDGNYLRTAATADKSYDMGLVAAAGTLSNSDFNRVLEMSLPLNTNTMLFYGKAPISTGQEFTHGHLGAYTVNNNLSNVKFQLGKCLSSDNKTKLEQIESLFAGVLTCIMNVNRGTTAISAGDKPSGELTEGGTTTYVSAYGFDVPTSPSLTWSQLAANTTGNSLIETTKDVSPLETKLVNAYKEMTKIQAAELRNGSGPALISTIKSLWAIINSVRCATPTSVREAYAKYMAELISLEISNYFTCNTLPINGASVSGVNFKAASELISKFKDDTYWPSSQSSSKPAESSFNSINNLTSTDLSKFPENYNLPQGAAHYQFDDTKALFSYVTNFNASPAGGSSFTVDDYYYPSELLYFGNSPIRVSDNENVASQYPKTSATWNVKDWSGWTTDGHVQSSTRSVAMKYNINYGTALLNTTVGYTSEVQNGTKLKDNNKYIQNRDYQVTEENNVITPTATSFKLISVLIGGQSPKVGWNFLPALESGDKQGYIYDKDITNNGSIPISGTSNSNYTLVFDNYKSGDAQEKVYVALELLNNTGQDFFGKDNLIPNGCNFYLIGELDPSGKSITDWPTYHALPPYIYSGEPETQTRVPRVFIQDYMTTANFKIGEWSLQYAYLTVPDLRSSSVTLGLSVDLNWSTGITFDNVVVGGNSETQVTP